MLRARLDWQGDIVEDRSRKATVEALFEASEVLLEESDRDVPIDKGDLQISGQTSFDEEKLQSAVSYDTPYAVRLHENPQYNFQHGRKGKWLEDALKNFSGRFQAWMKDRIRSKVGG